MQNKNENLISINLIISEFNLNNNQNENLTTKLDNEFINKIFENKYNILNIIKEYFNKENNIEKSVKILECLKYLYYYNKTKFKEFLKSLEKKYELNNKFIHYIKNTKLNLINENFIFLFEKTFRYFNFKNIKLINKHLINNLFDFIDNIENEKNLFCLIKLLIEIFFINKKDFYNTKQTHKNGRFFDELIFKILNQNNSQKFIIRIIYFYNAILEQNCFDFYLNDYYTFIDIILSKFSNCNNNIDIQILIIKLLHKIINNKIFIKSNFYRDNDIKEILELNFNNNNNEGIKILCENALYSLYQIYYENNKQNKIIKLNNNSNSSNETNDEEIKK